MRELKFRAWDDKNKKFAFVGFHIIGEVTMFNILEQYKFEEGIQLDITQFTGLKDKNGVDIYEGDILRSPAVREWETGNFMSYEVFFHNGDMAHYGIGYRLRAECHGSVCGGFIPEFIPKYTATMLLCGNIYENPELIKQSTK